MLDIGVGEDSGPCGKLQQDTVADVDGDGKLTLRDLWALASALWSRPGDARWNPAADLNDDGVVNGYDLWILLTSFDDPACR
jgi:hypothetical protein